MYFSQKFWFQVCSSDFLACSDLAKEKIGSELQMGHLDDTKDEDCLELSMGAKSIFKWFWYIRREKIGREVEKYELDLSGLEPKISNTVL